MGTPTHVTDFDPQTEEELARLESDAAAACRDLALRTIASVSISRYVSTPECYMTIVSYALPSGDYETELVAREATLADAFLALTKVVVDA
jgi:hypothetical protein